MAEIDEALIDRLIERLERISKERSEETNENLEQVVKNLKTMTRDISAMAKATVGEKEYAELIGKAFSENRRQEDREDAKKGRVGAGARGRIDPEAKRLEESLRKTGSQASSTLSSFIGRVGELDGSFVKLAGIVGLNYGAFRLLTTYLDGTVKSWRSVTEVGTGFSEGMLDMRLAAAHSRLNLEEFAGAVVKSSRAINALGIKDFGMLRRQVGDNLREFGMLGMTTEQITSTLGDYLEIQRITGSLERGQISQQSAGYQRLMLNMTMLSEASGIAREALLKQFKEATERYDIGAWLATASETQKEAWKSAGAVWGVLPKGMQEMVAKGIATGSVMLSEQARQMAGIAPDVVNELQEFSDGIRDGSLTPEEALRLGSSLKRQLTNLNQDQVEALQQMAANGQAGAQAFLGAVQQFQKFDVGRAQDDEERRKALKPFTKAMGDMQQSMSKITGALATLGALILEKLSPVFTWLAKRLEAFADSFSKLVEGEFSFENLSTVLLTGVAAIIAFVLKGIIAKFIVSTVLRMVGLQQAASIVGRPGPMGRGIGGIARAGGRGLRGLGRMAAGGLARGGAIGVGTALLGGIARDQIGVGQGGDTVGSMLEYGGMGAMIGSIIPGIGTAIGGAIGAAVGIIVANWEESKKLFWDVINGVSDVFTRLGEGISSAFGWLWEHIKATIASLPFGERILRNIGLEVPGEVAAVTPPGPTTTSFSQEFASPGTNQATMMAAATGNSEAMNRLAAATEAQTEYLRKIDSSAAKSARNSDQMGVMF